MQVMHFSPKHPPSLVGADGTDGSDGFYWLDIERSETDWHQQALRWLGAPLHEHHVRDSLNGTHPPFYDSADDYDILIVRALDPNSSPEEPTTQPIALIVSRRVVISVRTPGDPVFNRLRQRFFSGQRNSPNTPAMLLWLLLDQMTNALMEQRDRISERLSRWQDLMFDQQHRFDEWEALMGLRGRLRRLEMEAESQMDVVEQWRDQTFVELDQSLTVRFNDIVGHLKRVLDHAIIAQNDLDALVQIYFSANSHQTNNVLRALTVVSAIFLPLNLLAGIYGMNFTHLPLLRAPYGPAVMIAGMVLVVAGLLVWFRRRRWI